jgi:hypothetical protein
MDDFPELAIKTEPECKGCIDEKNSAINLRLSVTFIRGNPCTCDGVTQPGFRLATLCERIPDDKGFLTAYLQIKGKEGFTSGLARL